MWRLFFLFSSTDFIKFHFHFFTWTFDLYKACDTHLLHACMLHIIGCGNNFYTEEKIFLFYNSTAYKCISFISVCGERRKVPVTRRRHFKQSSRRTIPDVTHISGYIAVNEKKGSGTSDCFYHFMPPPLGKILFLPLCLC